MLHKYFLIPEQKRQVGSYRAIYGSIISTLILQLFFISQYVVHIQFQYKLGQVASCMAANFS